MNEIETSNNDDTNNVILNDEQKKESATNALYNYLDYQLRKNYYSWQSLQYNKQAIICELVKKYNITNESDIVYLKIKFDIFHEKLKKANEYQRQQYCDTIKYITEFVLYSIIFGFIILILTV